MATPKKLTDPEQRIQDRVKRAMDAAREVGKAQEAITRAKARHVKELERLDGEYRESLVNAVVILGAKQAVEDLGVKIPKAVRDEAKERIQAEREASREKARPAPASSPDDTTKSGPEDSGTEGEDAGPDALAAAEPPAGDSGP